MAAPEVVIYTTMFCPYCHAAKALLKRKDVAFRGDQGGWRPRGAAHHERARRRPDQRAADLHRRRVRRRMRPTSHALDASGALGAKLDAMLTGEAASTRHDPLSALYCDEGPSFRFVVSTTARPSTTQAERRPS